MKKLFRKALFDSVAAKLVKSEDNIRCPSQVRGCFVKGTRVHTKDGLKSIEQVQVDDYVLSSPDALCSAAHCGFHGRTEGAFPRRRELCVLGGSRASR